MIRLSGVEKVYRTGKLSYRALRGVDLVIEAGEMVAIVGPSGSGKTTILNLACGIDRPTAGTVTVTGRRIDALSEEELATWRGRHIGIVFQFFQLLPTLTALENALLPMEFARVGTSRERRRGPCTISTWWAWWTRPTTCPSSCRVASSSGWRSPAPWRATRRSSWATSSPATSTATPRTRCSTCSPD